MALPKLQLKDLSSRALRSALDRLCRLDGPGQDEVSWGYVHEGNDEKLTATRDQILEEFILRGEKP